MGDWMPDDLLPYWVNPNVTIFSFAKVCEIVLGRAMFRGRLAGLLLAAIVTIPVVAAAQEGTQQDAALQTAEEAVRVSEREHGPDHPDTATHLDRLARLYRDSGQYAMALPLAGNWL
jgi:hypothetical protein